MKKTKKRTLFLLATAVLIILILACCSSDGPQSTINTGNKVSVSTHFAKNDSPKSIALPEHYAVTTNTGEEYSTLLKTEITQNELYPEAITPTFVILNLNDLQFFNTEDEQANIFNTNGDYISLHNEYTTNINMLSTKGFSTYANFEKDLINVWHHLLIAFVCPWVGQTSDSSPEPYDNLFSLSMVGVKLPEGISKENVMNSLHLDENAQQFFNTLEYADEYVWFAFQDLVPFNCHYPAVVVFSDTIDTTRIYYKLNEEDVVSHYHVGYGNPNDSSNLSIIEIPVETMDFSHIENPEVEISYYAEDLIRFYEDDLGHFYAFFSPENPFPLSVTIKEFSETDSSLDESQAIVSDASDAAPIFCTASRFENDDFFTLQYTMPNFNGIIGVEIYHSNQNDISTAQMIYSGNSPVFRYHAENLFGEHYYWIRSVMEDGQKSDFKQFRQGFKGE